MDQFKADIASTLIIPPTSSADDAVRIYNNTLRGLADKHAPEQKKNIRIRSQTEWYTDEINEEKVKRRRLERLWKHTGLHVHHGMFVEQRNKVTLMIKNSKRSYYSDLITNAKDQKELYNITNRLLHKTKCKTLPQCTSDSDLAERFSSFFIKKIADIRESISQEQSDVESPVEYLPACEHKLSSFSHATEDEIRKLIMKSPSKSCQLDPIPTWLLKECIDMLIAPITSIINICIQSSTMPTELKIAHITPLLKKISLIIEILKNYRPVSGLPFI